MLVWYVCNSIWAVGFHTRICDRWPSILRQAMFKAQVGCKMDTHFVHIHFLTMAVFDEPLKV